MLCANLSSAISKPHSEIKHSKRSTQSWCDKLNERLKNSSIEWFTVHCKTASCVTQTERPANMQNLCKTRQNAACVHHAWCYTRRQWCLRQPKTRRVAAFCACPKCCNLMMFTKIGTKCMSLKTKNPHGNCHFGSLSTNVQNAATMRIFKISWFSFTFQKIAVFGQIQNMHGNCNFGAQKCILEPYAKCSYHADLVFITNGITETLEIISPNGFSGAKSWRHAAWERHPRPLTSKNVRFGANLAHTHTHTPPCTPDLSFL